MSVEIEGVCGVNVCDRHGAGAHVMQIDRGGEGCDAVVGGGKEKVGNTRVTT